MSIKNNFENLKFFQKVELYIIVIIFFIIGMFIYDNYIHEKNMTSKPNNNFSENKIKLLKSKMIKKEKNQIIKELDEIAIKYGIDILNSTYNRSTIDFVFNAKLKDSINFLGYINIHFELISFDISQKNKIISTRVKLEIKRYFNPNLEYKSFDSIVNPFKYNKAKLKEKNLNLNAIIGNNVLINSKIYTLFDIVNNHKIIEIKQNNISIKNIKTGQISTLKVYNDK